MNEFDSQRTIINYYEDEGTDWLINGPCSLYFVLADLLVTLYTLTNCLPKNPRPNGKQIKLGNWPNGLSAKLRVRNIN
jgi:hypothetical protein